MLRLVVYSVGIIVSNKNGVMNWDGLTLSFSKIGSTNNLPSKIPFL